jgi:hypothetical protein
MATDKTDNIKFECPSRLRLFLGFIAIAFCAVLDKRGAAELLALGLDAKDRLDNKRYKKRMMSNTRKVARRLKITGCTDAQMWYADKVGEIVPLVREVDDCYLSREPAGYINIVRKQDAEITYT